MNKKLAAIILAAGKGKRMNAKSVNKVAMPLADKPMIIHTIELLEKLGIGQIIVVVGFAKSSIINILGQKVMFAEQSKRLGTAHAVICGIKKISKNTQNVLVLNGDDSAFYTKEIIQRLVEKHLATNASFTFLTIEKDNPYGLGRVLRDNNGNVKSIIEEKDASTIQRRTKEINPGCYIFSLKFLETYLPKVKKSSVTKEYYLTSLIDIGIKNGEKIETVQAGAIAWRGINTKEELEQAQKLFQDIK